MPEREDEIRRAWREVPKFLRGIPFETYRFEQLPVTGEWGWKAPEGQAFRVSGHFVVDSDQDDIALRSAPQDSVEIWKQKYPGRFRNFLRESNGNEAEALRLLVEDEDDWGGGHRYDSPNFFDGRWLVISPSPQKGLSVKDRDDMYLDEVFKPASLKPPEVRVKADIQAWSEEGFVVLKDLNRGETDTEIQVVFDSPPIMIEWIQYYARPVFGKSRIYLVDCSQKDQKLYVPDGRDKSLNLPRRLESDPRFSGQDLRRRTFSMGSRIRRMDEKKRTQLEDFAKKGDVFVRTRDFFDESGLLVAYHDKRGRVTPLEEKPKYPRVYRP